MTKQPRIVPKVSVGGQKPLDGRLAYWGENVVRRAATRVFNAIGNSVRSLLAFAFEQAIELLEPAMINASAPLIDDLLRSDDLPSSVKDVLKRAKKGENANDWFITLGVYIAFVMRLGGDFTAPFGRLIQYQTEQSVQSHRPQPIDTILMGKMEAFSTGEVDTTLKEIGVHDRYAEGYRRLAKQWLNFSDLGRYALRDTSFKPVLKNLMGRKNIPAEQVRIFFELLEQIPPIQDLVRMAVREAFDDKIARQFGYDDNFPVEVEQWAAKQGLSSDWVRKYWRAHWELPGVKAGFEMLHRRIIDTNQLDLLLRARDIPSFWRKGLTELSYNPYTRVDVRRMFDRGKVSEEEVYENYRDLGYDHVHATKLTEWTVEEYGEQDLGLTKAEIVSAFIDAVITEEEAREYLDDRGLSYETVNILIEKAYLKKQERYEKEYVENVRLGYVGRQISEQEVVAKLNQLNPPKGFVEERLSIWELQRERSLAKPTKADLEKFLVNGIIGVDEVIEVLTLRNYSEKYISWYITLWTSEG